MEKKQEFKINIGGSSIILIIVVFALAIFAVLSIKASNSDLVLAKKTRTAISQFYQADSMAEEYLGKLDQVLKTEKTSDALQAALKDVSFQPVLKAKSESTGSISYEVMINESATLQVALNYSLDAAKTSAYDITTWKVNQQEIGDYDFNNFQFWDGTIEDE